MADSSVFPAGVYNLDVTYLADKIARYAGEVQMSVSSNVAFVNEFDMGRLQAYLDDIDAAIAYVTAQPQLDLPESHPMMNAIQPFPAMRDMESDEWDHVIRLMRSGYIELVNSQSSRLGAGLMPFDARRVSALVAKTRAWLNDYVSKRSPMDLPETSPQQSMSPAGKLGV
ncbi:MAG: hypothetical protein H6880_11375 [Rhodobiaceae bacterium]|nr:hypothetical protein [Rhodobiaceae bacterium]